MTLSQIYDIVANLVYGDVAAAPAPVHEVPFIRALILSKHKEIQQNYNYWFMRNRETISILEGVDTYALPADYKQIIHLDYDNPFQLIGNDIYFPEAPEADIDVELDYWRYMLTPAWDNVHTDAITQHCNWPIIYDVTAQMMLKREEKSSAAAYMDMAQMALASAQIADYTHRQAAEEIF